eukprot:COSAG03_NODE_20483_length_318_cov_1.182648_1_plen_43_part_10
MTRIDTESDSSSIGACCDVCGGRGEEWRGLETTGRVGTIQISA